MQGYTARHPKGKSMEDIERIRQLSKHAICFHPGRHPKHEGQNTSEGHGIRQEGKVHGYANCGKTYRQRVDTVLLDALWHQTIKLASISER